jgi:hypothetical protein
MVAMDQDILQAAAAAAVQILEQAAVVVLCCIKIQLRVAEDLKLEL